MFLHCTLLLCIKGVNVIDSMKKEMVASIPRQNNLGNLTIQLRIKNTNPNTGTYI